MTLPRTLHIELGRHRLGGTMQVYYLTRGLHQRGGETLLVTPQDSPLHQLASAAEVPVAPIKYRGDIDITALWKLVRIVRRFKPDIVHIHSRRGADTFGALAARLAGNAKVIIARRVDDPILQSWANRLRYGPLCDRVIAVSQGIVRALVKGGVPRTKIAQVYSAIEANKYQVEAAQTEVREALGLSADGHVLAVIAQLIPRKGHRFLFDALPRILERFPHTQVLLLGEGASEQTLREQCAQIGIGNNVIFAGYRDDIGYVLNAVDVLVHPATMEGFANVAMQAAAATIPVVTTDVGGMAESVLNEVTGLVVTPESPAAIAEAVSKLLADADLRARYGAAGKARVESTFTVDAMIAGSVAVYRELQTSERR